MTMKCVRPNCVREHVARGLCASHYQKARRAGILRDAVKSASPLIDAAGTRRRMRDLMLQGYSAPWLGEKLDVNKNGVYDLHAGKQRRVRADLAERVRKLHLAYEGIPGPSRRTENWAKARGYVRIDRYSDPDNPRSRPRRTEAAPCGA